MIQEDEMQEDEMIDISEVVKRSGQPASALRYYEQRGLIQSVGRHGIRRTFEPEVLERLAVIALGRAAGFSLDEIRQMFTQSSGLNIDRQMLTAKADELDGVIRKLKLVRDGLRHTAACPAPSHMQCPSFRRILAAAGKGRIPPLQDDSLPIRRTRSRKAGKQRSGAGQ